MPIIYLVFEDHLPFSALVVFLLFLARCGRYPRLKIVSSPKSAALRQLEVRGHLRIGSPLFQLLCWNLRGSTADPTLQFVL